ncbi:hypothetical protein BHE74_00058578 [Ensete ventricosum]|uniref:Uncharacterized protein n=1 Tax=Ensete ventricosum TaxID=4639 RepID=A0A444CCT2_ENSVE|nr:hypothetical protein GW17_00054650 [Ensete ventricosum]RWW36406.1 hypothetical protein BHE74_00058578 [Ensete ventricosum]RZR74618.1 hypothetical protein BHM03_00039360 [Ensete ventricosum]
MSGSSIHPRLGEVSGAIKSIAGFEHNTLLHFWQRSRKYPINTRVQKDMSNKSGIYWKYMRNNEIYMCFMMSI